MIDYISLALGHGLLAFAFMRLFMRDDLDVDLRIKDFTNKADAERAASTNAGRASRRRSAGAGAGEGLGEGLRENESEAV